MSHLYHQIKKHDENPGAPARTIRPVGSLDEESEEDISIADTTVSELTMEHGLRPTAAQVAAIADTSALLTDDEDESVPNSADLLPEELKKDDPSSAEASTYLKDDPSAQEIPDFKSDPENVNDLFHESDGQVFVDDSEEDDSNHKRPAFLPPPAMSPDSTHDDEMYTDSDAENENNDSGLLGKDEPDDDELYVAPSMSNDEFKVNADLDGSSVLSFATDNSETNLKSLPVIGMETIPDDDDGKDTSRDSDSDSDDDRKPAAIATVPAGGALAAAATTGPREEESKEYEEESIANTTQSQSVYIDDDTYSENFPDSAAQLNKARPGEDKPLVRPQDRKMSASPVNAASVTSSEAASSFVDDDSSAPSMKRPTSVQSMQYSVQSSLAGSSRLPEVAEEEDSTRREEAAQPDDPTKRSRRFWYIGGGAIIVLIAAIVVPIILFMGKGEDETDNAESREAPIAPQPTGIPTSAPTPAPTTQFPTRLPSISPSSSPTIPQRGIVVDLLAGVSFDGGDALNQEGTPQNQALEWLLATTNFGRRRLVEDEVLIRRFAMATLYFATDGENWLQQENWLSEENICNWANTEQDPCSANGNFVRLGRADTNMKGQLPPEVALLADLTVISLFGNQLTGSLPIQYFTEFSGLVSLDIAGNSIGGRLPRQLDGLISLQLLDFTGNNFESTIPTEIGMMASALFIHLTDNSLSGSIPSEMLNIAGLTELSLRGNELTGTAPPEICRLSLTAFEVDCSVICTCCTDYTCAGSDVNERVQGILTAVAPDGGDSMLTAGTSQNKALIWLSGNRRANDYTEYELIQRYALATLYYSNGGDNWISKTSWMSDQDVCEWYGSEAAKCDDSKNLVQLNLPVNSLIGSLASEIAMITSLTSIDLRSNLLTGTLPNALFTEMSLTKLDVFSNSISGEIPTEIGLQVDLTYLDLDSNELSGAIPTEIGQMRLLSTLYLNKNFLNGRIPTEISNLRRLQSVYLVGNDLTGGVPAGLCELGLTNLEADCVLICACCTNDCSEGVTRSPTTRPTSSPTVTVSPTSFTAGNILDIISSASSDQGVALRSQGTSQNKAFDWLLDDEAILSLPTSRALQRYALATLYYSTAGEEWNNQGAWLSSVDECRWFTAEGGGGVCNEDGFINVLDLDNNNMVGTLPPEISLLSDSLVFMDFFNNRIMGSLPSEIGLLTKLADTVDFDSNEISGSIPSELGLLRRVKVVWLNDNQLSGAVPTEIGTMAGLEQFYIHRNEGLAGTMPEEVCGLGLDKLQVDCLTLECSCCNPVCLPASEISNEPSRSPSISPPTRSPTASLPPTHSPTNFPSSGPTVEPISISSIEALRDLLSPKSSDQGAALSAGGTPQSEAVFWLASDGNLGDYTESKIVQRYVMATFYFSTIGPGWNITEGWLTEEDECLWYNNIFQTCDNNGNLISLRLDRNLLKGSIPPEISMLSKSLRVLDLEVNEELAGSIPSEMFLMSNLETLDLSATSITGTIATDVGRLRSLEIFRVFEVGMSGTIPTEFGRPFALEILDFGANKFVGTIPTEIGRLDFLTGLSFFGNAMTGAIPTELAQLSMLEKLYLDDTSFSGELPDGVCKISTIVDFWSDCDEIACECCNKCCIDGDECFEQI